MLQRSRELVNARALAWLGFFAVICFGWFAVYQMARGEIGWLCGPDQVLLLPYLGLSVLIPMWGIMMLAMMLPTILPTLTTYEALPAATGRNQAGWFGIVTGYSAVWLLGAVVFAALQVGFMNIGLLSSTGIASSKWTAVAILVVAGAWQFTRGKEICQDACLSPMQYFLGRFRPGFSGGVIMGAEVGLACVGCCWAIMGLAFVGGMTSLIWMGLATAFMVAEKLPEIGQHLRKPGGVVLMGMALWVAVTNGPFEAGL